MKGSNPPNKGKPSHLAKEKHHNWKGGPAEKVCGICSKSFLAIQARVRRAKAVYYSYACKVAAQDNGISAENEKVRKSTSYREWREAIFRRDDFTCVECGVRGAYLHADHIKPFAVFPDLRFDLANGRTLCRDCHVLTPTYGRSPARNIVSCAKGY